MPIAACDVTVRERRKMRVSGRIELKFSKGEGRYSLPMLRVLQRVFFLAPFLPMAPGGSWPWTQLSRLVRSIVDTSSGASHSSVRSTWRVLVWWFFFSSGLFWVSSKVAIALPLQSDESTGARRDQRSDWPDEPRAHTARRRPIAPSPSTTQCRLSSYHSCLCELVRFAFSKYFRYFEVFWK